MPKKTKRQASTPHLKADAAENRRERDGMRLWVRVLLVAAFHFFALLGSWWAFTPNPTKHGANPGYVPMWLGIPAYVLFIALVPQVSARLPKLLIGVAVLVAIGGQLVSVLGINAVAEHTQMRPVVATVERQEVLFDGPRRLHIEVDGQSSIAYSSLAKSSTTSLYADFSPGDRVNVLVDDSHHFYSRVTGGVGSDFSALAAALFGLLTVAGWIATELVCVSALTRRQSLMMSVPDDADPEDEDAS